MKRRLLSSGLVLLCISILFHCDSQAQEQQTLFPDLADAELLSAIQDEFTPAVTQTYAIARDSLFGRIDQVNDTLRCVYTGYKIYLDPTLDPTMAAFMDGSGLNTEHTYPQAKGASQEPARADMHHLFPTRVDINQVRDNFPFAEIPDNVTERWFYLNQFRNSIPTSNIDAYSEFRNGAFEPPEAHKGDVARAMFYFYTIYRDEALAADPNFFATQMQTLCNWHYLDPVDEKEWNRTWQIAHYQDGKANPFVLDCTLPKRLYCANTEGSCLLSSPTTTGQETNIQIQAPYPNPFNESITIPFELAEQAEIGYSVWNGMGQRFSSKQKLGFPVGKHQLKITRNQHPLLKPGLWWLRLEVDTGKERSAKWLKVIFQD
ncbi:MAG: endonuclease [Saprospiraceae bacterium]|nr:endonuclease [Saprospiraceae bacterium]